MRKHIDGRKKSVFYLLFSVLAIVITLTTGAQKADAALPTPTPMDPYGNTTAHSNTLKLDATSPNVGQITYSMPGPITTTRITQYPNTLGPIFSRLTLTGSTNVSSNHWVKVFYEDCGSYQESFDDPVYRVSCRVTFSNIYAKGTSNFIIDIGDYVQRGYFFRYTSDLMVTYEFIWYDGPNAGQLVNFQNNNAFLTFASLNGSSSPTNGEFVIPQNLTVSSAVYTISSPTAGESNVKVVANPSDRIANESYLGASNNFTDDATAIDFHRNSVSISLHSTKNEFIVGAKNDSNSAWFANYSMSLFRGNPGPPKKDAVNESGESIDGKDVLREETIYYEVKQRSAIMGTNILSPWASFSISDVLPNEVTYVSSSLEREAADGTRTAISASNAGTFSYNSSTREVKFVANATFLTTTNQYTGEYYVLKIRVQVKDSVPVKTIFKNEASTNIETFIQETNEVSNQIPYGNLELTKVTEDGLRLANVEFSIKDKNGVEQLTAANNKTDANGKIELQELHPGTYTITEVSVPWGYQLDTTPKTLVVKKESETTISKIEIVNYYTRFKIHLRQAVVGADNELVIPSTAYFSLNNVDNTGTSAYLYNVIASSSDKHSAPITQSLFTTRVMCLDAHLDYSFVDIAHIVPEYYEYLGYTVSKTGTSLSNDHIYTSSGYVAGTYPTLDYSNTLEYWVTVYIQPKYGLDDDGNSEDSPRPYSWDKITNDFGRIKLE